MFIIMLCTKCVSFDLSGHLACRVGNKPLMTDGFGKEEKPPTTHQPVKDRALLCFYFLYCSWSFPYSIRPYVLCGIKDCVVCVLF
jgi:hypothetical protein